MLSKFYSKIVLGALLATAAWGGTFGQVVSIGGHAADLALDEPRGVLYIANFTANRVDVMSLATQTIQTSINVSAQPSALAISPDDRYLVVAQYGNAAPPASSRNAITVIDLSSNGKQTFALGSAPLGVAFGIDGLALVVTSTDFLLLDPASGTTVELETIAGLSAKTLPQPAATFPPSIVAAIGGGIWRRHGDLRGGRHLVVPLRCQCPDPHLRTLHGYSPAGAANHQCQPGRFLLHRWLDGKRSILLRHLGIYQPLRGLKYRHDRHRLGTQYHLCADAARSRSPPALSRCFRSPTLTISRSAIGQSCRKLCRPRDLIE